MKLAMYTNILPRLGRVKTLKDKTNTLNVLLGNQTFRVFVGIFILSFAILFSVNMSGMSTKGYDIAELEQKITVLERENQKIDLKIANQRSMHSIQERLNGSDLVVADNIKYTTLVGSTVARR